MRQPRGVGRATECVAIGRPTAAGLPQRRSRPVNHDGVRGGRDVPKSRGSLGSLSSPLNTPPPTPLAYPELGAIISRVQSRLIRGASTTEVFDPLLTDLLEFTGSEYGFIADVLDDPGDGHRFLRIVVHTDISRNEATSALFEAHRTGERAIEFHDLDTLFGAAIVTG